MTTATKAERHDGDEPALAPWWHTLALVLLLVSGPVAAALLPHASTTSTSAPAVLRYVPLVGAELVFLLLVWFGLNLRQHALRELVGRRPAPRDLLWAAGGFVAVTALELLWPGAHAAAVLPASLAEKVAWVPVVAVVAVCEEVLFRGYFLRQLERFSGSVAFGVVAQALLFAVPHLQQGLHAGVKIALYGAGLGLLARARQSLWAPVLCHALVDWMSGLFRI